MIRRPPRSTPLYSSAALDVYKRQQQVGVGVRLIDEVEQLDGPEPEVREARERRTAVLGQRVPDRVELDREVRAGHLASSLGEAAPRVSYLVGLSGRLHPGPCGRRRQYGLRELS